MVVVVIGAVVVVVHVVVDVIPVVDPRNLSFKFGQNQVGLITVVVVFVIVVDVIV